MLETNRQRLALTAEAKRIVLDALNDAEQKQVNATQALIKDEQHRKLLRLTAPIGGTVQQLAMHTVCGVVTPAQPLLIVVPQDQSLEVEAFVENKDIGFVRGSGSRDKNRNISVCQIWHDPGPGHCGIRRRDLMTSDVGWFTRPACGCRAQPSNSNKKWLTSRLEWRLPPK